MSAQFGASEAFLILVTLYEKAKQKSSRGGGGNLKKKWLFLHCALVRNVQKIPSEVHTFPSCAKDTRLSRYVGKEATTTLLGHVRFWPVTMSE